MSAYDDEPGFWSITKADHMTEVSRDYETFSSGRGGVFLLDKAAPMDLQGHQIISMDPPRHTRLKQLFQRVFTPKMISEQEDHVREIVNQAIDKVAPTGKADVVQDIGGPVTARVIGSMLGTAPEMDQQLVDWANEIIAFEDPEFRPDSSLDYIYETFQENLAYVVPLIETRRKEPGDDLLSKLAEAEVDGDKLNDVELGSMFGLLISAGTDSTKSVYTSGMRALMDHPDQRQLLIDDPSLIPNAVEEVLRCFPAFSYFRRTVTRDVEFHGQQMHEGDKLALWYVSSNYDEDVYDDPYEFDVKRTTAHQAFGAGGRHFCLGAALARLELKVLLEETLRRLPDMERDGEPARTRSTFLNQYKRLPVRFTPERA
ncbi:MAG: cytochrome P450 [Solirubrobacterales bacterium]